METLDSAAFFLMASRNTFYGTGARKAAFRRCQRIVRQHIESGKHAIVVWHNVNRMARDMEWD